MVQSALIACNVMRGISSFRSKEGETGEKDSTRDLLLLSFDNYFATQQQHCALSISLIDNLDLKLTDMTTMKHASLIQPAIHFCK